MMNAEFTCDNDCYSMSNLQLWIEYKNRAQIANVILCNVLHIFPNNLLEFSSMIKLIYELWIPCGVLNSSHDYY